MWRRAGRILTPKEKDAANISQFRPIASLDVEGKIFFGVIAQSTAEGWMKQQVALLKRNDLTWAPSSATGCIRSAKVAHD